MTKLHVALLEWAAAAVPGPHPLGCGGLQGGRPPQCVPAPGQTETGILDVPLGRETAASPLACDPSTHVSKPNAPARRGVGPRRAGWREGWRV